jgi:hypothetical protein
MDFYDLKKYKEKWIGEAIIINNYSFLSRGTENPMPPVGSDKDVESIKASLKNLGFYVFKVFSNLDAEQMKIVMKRYEDHPFVFPSFACVIISYEISNNKIFGVNWQTVHLMKDLVAPITNCKSLDRKPKLFFVNTCRVRDSSNAKSSKTGKKNLVMKDGFRQENTIKGADVLVHYSTFVSNVLQQDEKAGSHVIQTICHVLDTYARRENVELVHLLRMVNDIVGTWFEFQAPKINDQLTKNLSFNYNKATIFVKRNMPIFR